MKRIVLALALTLTPVTAIAQDVAAPPKAPAPSAAAARPAAPGPVLRHDPVAEVARATADIADAEATCLREAARRVQSAALRLRAAADPAATQERRQELDFALGVLDDCRAIARKRERDVAAEEPGASAPPVAEPLSGAPAPAAARGGGHGLFSLGAIAVEAGEADASAVARALRSSAPRLARCYAKSGHDAGSVKLRMRMARRGKSAAPMTVMVERSSVDDPVLHRCLASALMRTRFPSNAAGSEVTLGVGGTPFSD